MMAAFVSEKELLKRSYVAINTVPNGRISNPPNPIVFVFFSWLLRGGTQKLIRQLDETTASFFYSLLTSSAATCSFCFCVRDIPND